VKIRISIGGGTGLRKEDLLEFLGIKTIKFDMGQTEPDPLKQRKQVCSKD
jgi:hypothetical protein